MRGDAAAVYPVVLPRGSVLGACLWEGGEGVAVTPGGCPPRAWAGVAPPRYPGDGTSTASSGAHWKK